VAIILVVDDEQPLRDLIAMIFEEAGHQAIQAQNGHQALELVNQQRPDLVLSDVMMPIMNGPELCRRLKSESATASIVVILMSTTGAWAADGAGADAFLTKPFDLDELDALVSRWLPTAKAGG
jgi:DNA-binding response OmpR family regulator